jgi:NADH-quinone oxidoreductase subunit H
MIWVRATWPRIRYDRLMAFGWKVLLPLSLGIAFLTATGILLADQYKNQLYYWSIPVFSIVIGLFTVAMVYRDLRRKAYERA